MHTYRGNFGSQLCYSSCDIAKILAEPIRFVDGCLRSVRELNTLDNLCLNITRFSRNYYSYVSMIMCRFTHDHAKYTHRMPPTKFLRAYRVYLHTTVLTYMYTKRVIVCTRNIRDTVLINTRQNRYILSPLNLYFVTSNNIVTLR